MEGPSVSVAIPTLDRGPLLLETVSALLRDGEAAEILVVDQTPRHPEEVEAQLRSWGAEGRIRWIRLDAPSIPKAMNRALRDAVCEIVLFLDDDSVPADGLVGAHAANYLDHEVVGVVGQVIQPWQSPSDLPRPRPRRGIQEDLDFPFHSKTRAFVRSCMAGNFSVRRQLAIAAGGFDERFVGAAYRFETEFCRRLTRGSGKVAFDPRASIRHLKADSGGIRVYGDGLRKSSIEHSVGDYYFAYLESTGVERLSYMLNRLLRTTFTQYYFRNPHRLPQHAICELKSIMLARQLFDEKRRERSDAKTVPN